MTDLPLTIPDGCPVPPAWATHQRDQQPGLHPRERNGLAIAVQQPVLCRERVRFDAAGDLE